MPGLATQLVILDRTIERLASSSTPSLQQAAQVMKDNLPFATLGAIGPALADFMPGDPVDPNQPSLGSSPYASVWTQVLAIAGGDGTPADPGALAVIGQFKRFLNKIISIADDEDLGALKDMRDNGEVGEIETLAASLKTIVDGLVPRVTAIGGGITQGMKPAVNVPAGQPVPPPATWTAREYLHWKHPGRFARALSARALSSGDPRFVAYAYGYLSSFAGSVSGSPFINSTIGASYRQQWWRYRWVNNYIDTWTYGWHTSGATMSGDTPSPPYEKWGSLCDANLQKRLEVGSIDPVDIMQHLREGTPFPKLLADDFAKYWMDAWIDAYGAPPLGSRFGADKLNGAFIMTWMKLWFETSGEVIGCNPAPPMAPPGNCNDAPSWVDPNVPGDNGNGQQPSIPEPESDPDVGEIVTGVILALLGAASLFFGGGLAGAAAIGVGVGLVIDGATDINWAKLRCDLYWLQMYLYNGLKALHDLLTLGAFTHPYPSELAMDSTTIQLLGIPYTFDSGKRLAKSRVLAPRELSRFLKVEIEGSFPAQTWTGGLGDWVKMPTGIEDPQTTGYLARDYPTFFIDDDAANPLTPDSDVRTGTTWPPGERRVPGTDVPVLFG
ncbi:MAG TPA: hypothetical protein VNZ58_09070, partial [Thermomicrobiales bacterium]|nr:hypothetical protein [Thermomicrobiales bacterium]